MSRTADVRLGALLHIAEGTGKGQRVADMDAGEAEALFGVTPETFKRAAPASVSTTTEGVQGTPTGKFTGRTAAEKRAFELEGKPKKGVRIYAGQVKGHWCVIKQSPEGSIILEG